MRLKIYFSNEQDKIKVGFALRRLIKKAILTTLKSENFTAKASVSVTFTDNGQIREKNREFRDIDSATDVLSFPMYDLKNGDVPLEGEIYELGDIVLSLERALEQATEFGHSFERECAFLTAHSTLHLLGYDHVNSDEEDRDMRARQGNVMKLMGLGINS